MKAQVLDKNGKKIEDIDLSPAVFGAKPNDSLVSQYLRVFLFNQRQGNASTKDRGEVSGSGRKPWRQKGTGNARVGSKRTPLWRHGGTVHGPKPKSWRLEFPKRMRRQTILTVLSQKQSDKKIKIIDKLDFKNPSTKDAQEIVDSLKLNRRSLVVLDNNNPNAIKSFSNIGNAATAFWNNVNAHEIIKSENVLFTKDAILKLQEKYETK